MNSTFKIITMKTLLITILLGLTVQVLLAQTPINSINGTIKDTQNEAVPGATIRLLKTSDSTQVKGEITNGDGKFQFRNLHNGNYLLSITAIGFKTFKSVVFTLDEKQNNISLPVIILLPAQDVALKEVTVKAKKPLIEQEIDKTIVNVESMISSASSNTLEVLGKTPGVTVDNKGEISLNGRGGVLVLIDGRSTYMSGQDLAAYLKSIPGGILDKIELMENPSAKYDAAGNAVINIRLKKNRIGGLTGSVSTAYSQGRYGRNNDALNLNYNRKKINLFGNIGYNNEKSYADDDFLRKFYSTENLLTSTIALTNNQITKSNSVNVNLGLDYAMSKQTTYGILLNINAGKRNGLLDYTSHTYDTNQQLHAINAGSTLTDDKRNNIGANLNFQHRFKKAGRELSGDINYLNYQSKGTQNLNIDNYLPDGMQTSNNKFLYLLPSGIHIYTLKTDYTHTLKNKAKFEAGFKSSIVDNDNIFNYFDVLGKLQTIDNSKSNHFKYQENINALYVNTQKSWKRVGAQLGLRAENTQAKGQQLGNEAVQGSTFTKSYIGLFPSLFISYKLDSLNKNTVSFSATRRINRPNYQLLNPFLFFRDQYTYSSGNAMLNPQYQYRYEVKYQYKEWLFMGLSYNKFIDVIFQTTQAVDNIFISRPDNIAQGYMYILNTTVNFSPVKWWYLSTTLRLSSLGLHGKVYTEALNPNAKIARLELNNYFTINKSWSAEFSGYYASKDLSGQTVTKGMYRLNADIQKKIWKDKGSIRLSFNDIFHSWVYQNRSISLRQAEYFQTNTTDTQRVNFALTYRFGKDTFARKRRHNDNAADAEKGRID